MISSSRGTSFHSGSLQHMSLCLLHLESAGLKTSPTASLLSLINLKETIMDVAPEDILVSQKLLYRMLLVADIEIVLSKIA